MYRIVELICCTHETNITRYVNYTLIKKKKKRIPPLLLGQMLPNSLVFQLFMHVPSEVLTHFLSKIVTNFMLQGITENLTHIHPHFMGYISFAMNLLT